MPKVVIVIEGIDECIDLKGNLVEPQFWLPSEIPRNIKLIISTKSINEDLMKNATILRHHISQERSNKIIGNYHNRVVSLHKANS